MTVLSKPAIQTPTSARGVKSPAALEPQKMAAAGPGLGAIGLSMAWQLLIVVVAPILAGHWLDRHYHKASLWTIVGLIVSVAGMITVVWQTNRQITEYMQTNTKKDTK